MEFIVGAITFAIIAIVYGLNTRGKDEKAEAEKRKAELERLKNQREKIDALKRIYDECLNHSDKRAALKAGRAYYTAARADNTLTVYDEQAMANDLSTMS